MRLLFIAAACALAAAGSAAAQTRGLAPHTSPNGAPATVQTGHTAAMPGPAAKPATMAGSAVVRPATMGHPAAHAMTHHAMTHHAMTHHAMARHGMRHHWRHHGRTHSASWCTRRANAHHMSGTAMTHYVERCQAGRHHHRHHGAMHHTMHHAAAKPATSAK